MACGSPVIAARVSALPEVLGDAAVFARAGDVDDWTTVITDLVADGDRRSELRELGRQRAEAMTWQATAEGTAAVYRALGVELLEPTNPS
jgi:glycosyltransferase involved in cell wall biosynthesis